MINRVFWEAGHTPWPQVFSIICWEENMHFWYSTSLITRLVFLMLLKCGKNVGLAQWLIVAKNSGSKYFSPSKLGGPSAKMFIFGTCLSIFVEQSLAYFYTRKGHMKVKSTGLWSICTVLYFIVLCFALFYSQFLNSKWNNFLTMQFDLILSLSPS